MDTIRSFIYTACMECQAASIAIAVGQSCP
jgi:hypothetical protein